MSDSNKPVSEGTTPPVQGPISSVPLQQYYQDKLENARQHLPEIAQQLREAGVARVHIEYDGCGDSGQIEKVTFLDAEGRAEPLSPQVGLSEDALMDAFYDLTQARHPGWENNEGAFGEFAWDLTAGTLAHVHNERFTDYATTEHEGL